MSDRIWCEAKWRVASRASLRGKILKRAKWCDIPVGRTTKLRLTQFEDRQPEYDACRQVKRIRRWLSAPGEITLTGSGQKRTVELRRGLHPCYNCTVPTHIG